MTFKLIQPHTRQWENALSIKEIKAIKFLHATGSTKKQLCKDFNLTNYQLNKILHKIILTN